MPMYVKKPIPIEARQIAAENAEELAAWSKSDVIFRPVDGSIAGMMVYTLEGTMTGSVGDYLIKGVRGEFYFCAKDIFEETYEDYEEPSDPHTVEVNEFIENADGSANIVFTIGSEALKTFAKIGLLDTIRETANKIVSEEVDNTFNDVGC